MPITVLTTLQDWLRRPVDHAFETGHENFVMSDNPPASEYGVHCIDCDNTWRIGLRSLRRKTGQVADTVNRAVRTREGRLALHTGFQEQVRRAVERRRQANEDASAPLCIEFGPNLNAMQVKVYVRGKQVQFIQELKLEANAVTGKAQLTVEWPSDHIISQMSIERQAEIAEVKRLVAPYLEASTQAALERRTAWARLFDDDDPV